jgi:myo-inositol-1(or 4)-monophosphatase
VTSAPSDALLDLAVAIALEAGELAAGMRARGVEVAHTKTSHTDIVTAADRACERLIRDRVLASRPDDAVLGEEEAESAGTSGVRWIVDPIDGTVNYAHGLPRYAISIGVEVDGVTVAGVVHNPAAGLTYTATLGGGAFRNGAPIAAAAPVPLDEALVSTGFNYRPTLRASQAAAVARLLPRVADIRRFGSCSLDLCDVAEGSVDGYVEEGIGGPWDYAAGALIAGEAGARAEVLVGASGATLLVASPASTYDDFLALVAECGFLASTP